MGEVHVLGFTSTENIFNPITGIQKEDAQDHGIILEGVKYSLMTGIQMVEVLIPGFASVEKMFIPTMRIQKEAVRVLGMS